MVQSRVIVLGACAVGLALLSLWLIGSRPSVTSSDPIVYVEGSEPLSDYVRIQRLAVLTSENYLGEQIRVIEGTLLNVSGRTLRSVELHLVFSGFEGEAVLESDQEALRTSLSAGEERTFSFRFAEVPSGWNFRVPEVEIRAVGY